MGWCPAADGSMTASRPAPRAIAPSANTPSSSGPRWAIRLTARMVQSASGLAPPASARHPAIPDIPPLCHLYARHRRFVTSSLRLYPDAPVEPDDLRVHVLVLDQRPHQLPELVRSPQPLREHHRLHQLGQECL